MPSSDKTKQVLEQILAQIHADQAKESRRIDGSYLIAQDQQLLGKINYNRYDTESILNPYGPYGSKYSNTSIFNKYSPYGSPYGAFSVNNPYCNTPPKLFINGNLLGYVTVNKYVQNRIQAEDFLYTLQNDLNSLLTGRIVESVSQARQIEGESFIEAGDGTFLGKLNPNQIDEDSIFNQFGPYGNEFSQQSIFNTFSQYGGNQFSHLSPYNAFSSNPPKIYINGHFVAYLTVKTDIQPRVDPDEILEWAEKNVPAY